MKVLFVVQRYGPEIAGGAELLCSEYATRLARRGHDISVVTSRALSYIDWADHYPAGDEVIDGVRVHRLGVVAPRDDARFNRLNARVAWGGRPPLYLQQEWIRAAGPRLRGLDDWLVSRALDFDVVVFFTYLYWPTWRGLPLIGGLRPTVFHPTAHDEPMLWLPLFEPTFRHAGAFGFLTEEEAALVRRRSGADRPAAVVGVGVDLDPEAGQDGGDAFRRHAPLGDRPYLVCIGRVDPAKGSEELFDFFVAYKDRNPGPLALAFVGDAARALPAHPDVVVTGTVPASVKHSAMAGAVALVQPSFNESYSMVLDEAWALSQPALVQGYCDVLVGRAARSGGGLPYRGFAEFEVLVDRIVEDQALRRRLGRAGRSYVESSCCWDDVLVGYEDLLARARRDYHTRRKHPRGL